MKIVCVGDCGVDHYLPSHELHAGGITSNFARQARRSFHDGDEIHVISATGTDQDNARIAREGVQRPGIDCHLETLSGRTPVQYIEIMHNGEKDFVRYDEGVLRNFRLQDEHAEVAGAADLLVTPVFQQNREMFDSVMSAPGGGKVAVDFADFAKYPDFDHLERYLQHIDVAFFGLSEDQQSDIERIRGLAITSGKLLIVTLGAAGSIAFGPDDEYRLPAISVPIVIDTTGAGDAFAAEFLGCYMHGSSVLESQQAGAERAAKTIQKRGAVPF